MTGLLPRVVDPQLPLTPHSAEKSLISGYGPRAWKTTLPSGLHEVAIIDLGRQAGTVYKHNVRIGTGEVVVIQYRCSYRRWPLGSLRPADCWVLPRRRRTTWFAPARR
jgi:hypothetical protein